MATFGIVEFQVKHTAYGWTWVVVTTNAAHDPYTTSAHWDEPMEALADAVKFIEHHTNELAKFERDQEMILKTLETRSSFDVPRQMMAAANVLEKAGRIRMHLWRYSYGPGWIAERVPAAQHDQEAK